jgi:hypothetical protein
MPKMITIGKVGSAPHIREIYSYRRCLPFFSFLGKHTARMGMATWTIKPQSTQIFSRKCLLRVPRFAKTNLGVIFAPKIETSLKHCTNMKFLHNF